MKTIEELLKNLARPEVLEFGLVTHRLPSVNIGGKFEPVDDEAPSTERVMQMLVAMGGGRHVETLGDKPVQWTTRLDGVGVIAIAAIMRKDIVQARFTVAKREVPAERSALATTQRSLPDKAIPQVRATAPQVQAQAIKLPRVPPVPVQNVPELDRDPDDEPTLQTRLAKASGTGPNETRPKTPRRSAAVAPSPGPIAVRKIATPTSVDVVDIDAAKADASSGPAPMRLESDLDADSFLAMAVATRASELFIVAGRPIVLRIAADLHARTQAVPAEHVERIAKEIVPARLREALERDGSCDFAIEHPTHGRFRVNVSRQRTGFKLNLRVIPKELPTLATLGLPDAILDGLRHQRGLVLVTGPACQGKSTTLAALVDHLNRERARHIMTVENPIEHLHPRKKGFVSQRDVAIHARTQARTIRTALREDIDTLVLGEIRDAESVRHALVACESGRLVLGTMNAPAAAKAIDRMLGLLSPAEEPWARASLASSLRLIVGQRLVPSADRTRLHVAVELLPWSAALYTLVREGRTHEIPDLQQRGKNAGALCLDESLAELVRAQKVTAEVAKQFAESPADRRASSPAAVSAVQARKA
jgi:twitching motility protein PilT